MWLYMIAGFLFVLALIGTIAGGGIFTLIFVPLGLSMLVVAAVTAALARASEREADGGERPGSAEPRPLPSSPPHETPRPSRPEDLVDARRGAQ